MAAAVQLFALVLMSCIPHPQSSSSSFHRNVRDYGAVGDGVANDTRAIQCAIDAGGIVHFPPGTYRTGTVYLRSDGGLELSPDATLLASTDPADYNPKDQIPQEAGSQIGGGSQAHLVIAHEVENVSIRGGCFRGNGHLLYQGVPFHDRFTGGTLYEAIPWRPAQLLYFCECRNLRLSDFAIRDSTSWSCFLHGCESVTIRGLDIATSPYIGEDDGLDLDCCRFVTVSDCRIDVGDDALTFRASPKKLKHPVPCEWITVTNCLLRSAYAHAIRVGVGSGVIRHCSVSNTAIRDSHCAIHINSLYSDRGGASSGVEISDIAFRGLDVSVEMLASICLDYKFVKETRCAHSIRDVTFAGITGHVSMPSRIVGNGVGVVEGIRFQDVHLRADGDCTPPARTMEFLMLRRLGCAFLLQQAKDVSFDRVAIQYEHPQAWPDGVVQERCSGTGFFQCSIAPLRAHQG